MSIVYFSAVLFQKGFQAADRDNSQPTGKMNSIGLRCFKKREECFFFLEAFKGVNSPVHTEKAERNVGDDIAV